MIQALTIGRSFGRLGGVIHVVSHVAAIYVLLRMAPDFVQYIFPQPHKVLVALVENDLALKIPNAVWIGQNVGLTLIDALAGFILGNGIAIILATAMLFAPPIRPVVLRNAIALRSIPWIVLVPILMLILGPTWQMRVTLVSLATFFSTLLNFYTGLLQTDKDVLDYTRTLPGITKWLMFRHVQLYYSLPLLFAAFKNSASVVILSSVVVEWLTGGNGGLGWLLYVFNIRYRMDLLLALAITCGILSYSFMRLVSAAETRVMNKVTGETNNDNI